MRASAESGGRSRSQHSQLGLSSSMGSILCSRFYGLHVLVRQAEMVSDLMHQHVRDDGAERLFVLRPVVEDGATEKPDSVRKYAGRRCRGGVREPNPFEEPQQIEG